SKMYIALAQSVLVSCVVVVTTFIVYPYFFLSDVTSTTYIYTLSLHDALPISLIRLFLLVLILLLMPTLNFLPVWFALSLQAKNRSEERFSRNAETDLVCRLLLEKKKATALPR